MIDLQRLKAPQGYIINPVWDQFETKGGISKGEEFYDHTEQFPVEMYPVHGYVVSTSIQDQALPGDIIYFTWNGVSFNKCISPIADQNLFSLNKAWFAFRQDGALFTFPEFLLLSPVEESDDDRFSEGGLMMSGFNLSGNVNKVKVEREITFKKLYGIVHALPKGGHSGVSIGDRVAIQVDSDVEVEIEDQIYYRCRFTDLLYKEYDN